MTRPVFVLGTGRCGSTLVHEVLARHVDTGFLTNLDDLGVARSTHWHNEFWRRLPPGVTRKGGARFAPSEGYRLLGRSVGPLLVDPVRDLAASDATPWIRERLVGLVEDRADRLGAPVFLHKFTGWSRAGLLHACFPDAVFVEVVRDGRAVTSSWLQMPWWRGHLGPELWHFGPLPPDLDEMWTRCDRSFPVLAALAWRLLIDSYAEARAKIPAAQWVRVRYEDVIFSPRDAFAGMLQATDLEWSARFESGFGRYSFSAARTESFRRDLSPGDIAAVERVLGPQLTELGYL